MGTLGSLGPGFRALYRGALVSNVGDGIRLAALPLLATSLTTSPFLVAAVTAAQYLAWLAFGPFGGALVDRADRRRTVLTTQLWRGLLMAGLGLLVWSGHAAIWHVCVVAFAITIGEILVDPSTVALVPTLVDDVDLERANGRIAGVEIVTNDFAGAPVGAALYALAPWLPFVVDACSYLGSLLPFRRLPRRTRTAPSSNPAPRLRTDAADGFRWLRRHRVLAPFTVSQVIYYFGFSAGFSLLVVLVTEELDGSAVAFGVVLAIGAGGAFLGSLAGARVSSAIGTRATLSGCVALQGATLAAASIAPSLPAVAALWLANGIPAGLQRPVARSMQQRLTPNHLLGRVNVTTRIFTRGIIVFGALAAGALASTTDIRWSFAVGGAIQVVAAVAMWRVLARLRA
ncbi:MAG TPA: MFS transporter [Acidimicrobiales bacterium]|nr:MFS transporter [Acidimicrobiales bacterium]